jgi:NAD(P)-dependent dehydrogenase (short-subunit alcohol dehydrogenase family)
VSVTDLRLDGQAAIVTGASSGLGVIIARGLAARGCAVVLAARRADLLRGLAQEITAADGRAVAHPCDVRDHDHADVLADRCVTAFGRLDGVVANAGIAGGGPAEDHDPARFAEVMAVNVDAAANLAAAGARRMIATDSSGWIILQSSILGRRAGTGPGVAAYTASKGAVEQLTRELARQWAPHRIRVNALAPGYFPSEMNAPMVAAPGRLEALLARIPMGRSGEPDDLTGVVAFLASDAARYVTGQVLAVDGGMSVW